MIGELMRLHRTIKNIGVREFAKEIGVSAATVSRIERGDAMSQDTMVKVMNWLFFRGKRR